MEDLQHPKGKNPIKTMPLTTVDKALMEAFAQDLVSQASRLDELAKNLITLGLAIPGLFVTFVKPIPKPHSDSPLNLFAIGALVLWFLGFALVLWSLFPKKYEIDPTNLSQLREYFFETAKYKRILLSLACMFWMASFFIVFYVWWSLAGISPPSLN